jgi:hypothetical protein
MSFWALASLEIGRYYHVLLQTTPLTELRLIRWVPLLPVQHGIQNFHNKSSALCSETNKLTETHLVPLQNKVAQAGT